MRGPGATADSSRGMLRRLSSDESGIALILAVITMGVLASLTASVVFAVTVNHRSAAGSANSDKAFALAEQALAYAEGRLYSSATSGEPTLVPSTTFTQDGGTGTYSGVLSGSTWTLTGQGVVGGVTRKVTSQATVPAAVTVPDPTPWSYLYSDSHASCSTTISDGVDINVPLYAQGGLCVTGEALSDDVNFTGSDLEVGGNLSFTGNKVKIGKSNQPISKMNVVGTCPVNPCDGAHSPIYVNAPGVGHTLTPSLAMPTVDLSGNYTAADPGPTHACQTGSGIPSPFFDSNATLNNSVASINLFPAGVSYDCKIGTNEIKWDGSENLTVNGRFYFDGSLNLSTDNKSYVYSGSGTLYFTGTVNFSGDDVNLCAVTGVKKDNHGHLKDCKGNWNPDTNGLIIVAGCWANTPEANPASPTLATTCMNLSGKKVTIQAGLLAKTGFTVTEHDATVLGPVLADTITMAEETDFKSLKPFHTLPTGAPSNGSVTIFPPALPATNWNG
jgi:Tfp pilus assembly protein PilX